MIYTDCIFLLFIFMIGYDLRCYGVFLFLPLFAGFFKLQDSNSQTPILSMFFDVFCIIVIVISAAGPTQKPPHP